MHTLNKTTFVLAICLSAMAGCVDAIGFLHLGGYFISFMSGNSTRFAVHLIEGDLQGVALLGMIILLFVIGTMIGVIVRHSAPQSSGMIYVLACVTTLLTGAALSHTAGEDRIAIALLTLAMGAENAILQRNGEVVVGLTYMTGTLVKLGQRLAVALLGGTKLAWLPYLLLWLGLISGGVTGTLLFNAFGLQSIWVVAVWAGTLTSIAALIKQRLTA